MATDPFDLNALRVSIEQAQQLKSTKPIKRKKWRRHFVQVPWWWVERLKATKRVSTVLLGLLLLYEHWHNGGDTVVVSNELAAELGLSPRSKSNALADLKRLGLVEMVRRRGHSPRVVLRHMGTVKVGTIVPR
jgi:DNA-binding MarR family transcriptional regulator